MAGNEHGEHGEHGGSGASGGKGHDKVTIHIDKEKFQGRMKTLPSREDLTMPIREQLIVELYSK